MTATTSSAMSWTTWGTAAVGDGLSGLGHPFQVMESVIKPIGPGMALAGPAFTVRCYPGATWALEQALELASPGDVLVVDGGAATEVILMGELMSTRAQQRGLAGVVVDGAVRDTAQVRALGFPMFARAVTCRCGTHAQIGQWQTTVCCGRVPVRPGDWVVADGDGIVCVPPDLLDAAAEAAEAIHRREARIAEALGEGLSLPDAAARAKGATGESAG